VWKDGHLRKHQKFEERGTHTRRTRVIPTAHVLHATRVVVVAHLAYRTLPRLLRMSRLPRASFLQRPRDSLHPAYTENGNSNLRKYNAHSSGRAQDETDNHFLLNCITTAENLTLAVNTPKSPGSASAKRTFRLRTLGLLSMKLTTWLGLRLC
jgi:hypothetical protein